VPTLKDNAICLRLLDWSETSQIVVLLSEQHGKISATAKGAKRQTPSVMAKFSGGLELLTRGEAVLIVKPSTELANLIEWDLQDAHWHLRRDWRAFGLAMYAADLVHHLVSDHDAHPVTFAALRDLLADLAEPQRHDAALLRFQWTLVRDLGYSPVLDRDAETGEPFTGRERTLAFSAIAGGAVADTGAADRWRARRATIELLRALDAEPAEHAADAASLQRANRLLCTYFRAILDRELTTMRAVLGRQ